MADGAPTELEIVLAVGLQRCRADGALIFENGFDARPHPGLLPRGEGESFAGFPENLRLDSSGRGRAIRK